MLTGAADEAQANAGLRWATDLADASAQRLANIACWAFHLYPSDSPGPIRIQPDKLHDIPVGRRAARVEFEYERGGTVAYFGAYDVAPPG